MKKERIASLLSSRRLAEAAGLVLETSFLAFLGLLFFSRPAGDVALILVGLSWVVYRLSSPPFWPPGRVMLPLLVFLASMLLSTLWAEDRSHSFQQFVSQAPKMVAIFLASWEYLRTKEHRERFFWVSTTVLLLVGVDGIMKFLRGEDVIGGVALWRGRVRAHFARPTFFEYVLPMLPWSLALGEGKIRGWWRKGMLGMAGGTFVFSSLLSRTRSVWLALGLISASMVAFSRRRLWYLLLLAVVLLSWVALPLARGRSNPFSLSEFVEEQRYQRMLAWQITFRMFLDRPLLGKGPDFFENYERNAPRQEQYVPPNLRQELKKRKGGVVFPIYHPHNIYLEILASQGLLGLAAFLFLLVMLLRNLGGPRGRASPLFMPTAVSLFTFLFCGTWGTSAYDFWSYGVLWLLAGMGMRLGEEK